MIRIGLVICAWIVGAPAFAKTITNVTVCAVACNSEVEAETNIDNSQAGTIYFAEYKSDTKSDPGTCMEQAKHLPTYEFKPTELEELSQKGCSEILQEKFFGKRVDIVVANGKNSIPFITEIIIR